MPPVDTRKDSIRDLGAAAFNMSYVAFRQALDLVDDDYARDKYEQLKAIGRAMGAFSDTALAALVERYKGLTVECGQCAYDAEHGGITVHYHPAQTVERWNEARP